MARLHGKKVKAAREEMVAMLEEQNLLAGQKEVTRMVKCAERSKAPIEILVSPQWFIKVLDKKAALFAKAVECHWYPDFMKVRIENWIEGLKWDWCISRQRYFGRSFPDMVFEKNWRGRQGVICKKRGSSGRPTY